MRRAISDHLYQAPAHRLRGGVIAEIKTLWPKPRISQTVRGLMTYADRSLPSSTTSPI